MFVGPGPEQLLVNEIAPRVHNSGHWTSDVARTSQFEQHLRAVCGWPLGDTERHSDVVMSNLIGDDIARWLELAAAPGARVHIYGKAESRPGRKMGHLTALGQTAAEAAAAALGVREGLRSSASASVR